MKLRKKIRYIILPIVVLFFSIVTSVYYGIYKKQIIESKIYSLNEYLRGAVTKTEYDLIYARNYIQHKIDSKEASLIFSKNEQGEKITAPYINQFLEQFINERIDINNRLSVVNDFIVYDANENLIIHINTKDPFAEPTLKIQTKKLFDNIKINDDKKIAQYFYFIDNTEGRLLNIIQVFSPYKLTSQQFYNSNDDLYIIQSQLSLKLIRSAVKDLVDQHQDYMASTLNIRKNELVDEITTTLSLFESKGDAYQAKVNTELFDLFITLDDSYFSENLNAFLIKLFLLSVFLVGISYFIVVKLIDNQIIIPITKLAKSIKNAETSLNFEIKPLNTNDEVSELNESYISLIKKIKNLANNDSLTGLSNRRSFTDSLSTIIDIENGSDHYVALFFIDLDNFKYVNDTFGHEVGDSLLVEFSERLRRMLEKNIKSISSLEVKSIARLGGDEFVILLNGFPSMSAIEQMGENICNLFNRSFNISVNTFNVHASVGISYTNVNIENGEKLLNQADTAMYLAKDLGKNNYKLFTSEIEEIINNELKVENKLVEALDNNYFVLVFMPAYTAENEILKGYEVLLRCPSLTSIGIGPEVFIPIAEKTDLILIIDLWVAENAFIKLKELINETGFDGFFAINVSSKSLRNDNFYNRLKALIRLYQIDVKQIELEITETCLMPDDYQAIASLNLLKSLGVSIAIDDFGTGFTSFSQLVNYPLDTLKIDRSFVQDLAITAIDKKPTLDIIYELAKVYELEVIIEGIETESDLQHVKNLPDAIVQGYYFTMPCDWEEIITKHKE